MAIAAHFRNRKFKTLIGEVEMPGQVLDKVYTVGQWQGGFFNAVERRRLRQFRLFAGQAEVQLEMRSSQAEAGEPSLATKNRDRPRP